MFELNCVSKTLAVTSVYQYFSRVWGRILRNQIPAELLRRVQSISVYIKHRELRATFGNTRFAVFKWNLCRAIWNVTYVTNKNDFRWQKWTVNIFTFHIFRTCTVTFRQNLILCPCSKCYTWLPLAFTMFCDILPAMETELSHLKFNVPSNSRFQYRKYLKVYSTEMCEIVYDMRTKFLLRCKAERRGFWFPTIQNNSLPSNWRTSSRTPQPFKMKAVLETTRINNHTTRHNSCGTEFRTWTLLKPETPNSCLPGLTGNSVQIHCSTETVQLRRTEL